MSTKEVFAAKKSDLKNGEMKTISVGDGQEILLSRINDKFYATAAYCTHYGAPLADGVLSGDRIVCPWHHACFNVKSGALEEPPARDSLQSYKVKIDGDDVKVLMPDSPDGAVLPDMAVPDYDSDRRTFVIIGGGAAGNAAAQAMREAGYAGKIIMITHENRAPYDRPNLSKDYLQGTAEAAWMPLRPDEFYKEHGIELLFDKRVKNLDTASKKIQFEGGGEMSYDKILIATGGIPVKPKIKGAELKNIFYLRSFDDSDAIIKASEKAKEAVVVGASFIGMEAAHSLSERKLKVTVVAPESTPFEKVFGKEIGHLFKKNHEDNGIQFKLGRTVKSFDGNGQVKAVGLDNGDKISADIAVIGIGVKPATGFIGGLDLQKDGGIKVDEYLSVGADVYAAGDIASVPYKFSGTNLRIEHWRTAEQQGRAAGMNMAGQNIAFNGVPFFWTSQAGITLNYSGHAKEWDEIIYKGDVAGGNFLAYYIKDGKVTAAAGVNKDKEIDAVEELFRLGKMPGAEKVRTAKFNPTYLI